MFSFFVTSNVPFYQTVQMSILIDLMPGYCPGSTDCAQRRIISGHVNISMTLAIHCTCSFSCFHTAAIKLTSVMVKVCSISFTFSFGFYSCKQVITLFTYEFARIVFLVIPFAFWAILVLTIQVC